ncbi:MAG: translation initiation factor [Candidatus Sumerlaeaceae bacterium]
MSGPKDSKLVFSTASGDLRKEEKPPAATPSLTSKPQKIRVTLDTRNRRGKAVTVISGIQHNPQAIDNLARTLKNHCGAGGTVETGSILIQGDHRDKIIAHLKQLGYSI